MSKEIDAQSAFTGTVTPTGADRLDEAKLTAWMSNNVEGFEGPVSVEKFAGGQSNPTYKIVAKSANYVLRRKPLGKLLPSAHAVDREFKVISGLHPTGFPVAKPYGLCEDDDVIGSMFYIMEMVEGRSFWNGSLPDSNPIDRRAIYMEMFDVMAALHNVDVDAAGLSDFGKPGNYFGRQIGRWSKQYKLSETEHIEEMEQLIKWLPETIPEQERTSIAHGDFRIDNNIYDAKLPKIRAVLDWELSTLGDPLADFTYVCLAWATPNGGRSGVMDIDRKALGIPELEEVVERYCEATQRSGLPDMNWYFAYNFFRLAAIVQGIIKLSMARQTAHMRRKIQINLLFLSIRHGTLQKRQEHKLWQTH